MEDYSVKEEIFDIVDDSDNIIGSASREFVHGQ